MTEKENSGLTDSGWLSLRLGDVCTKIGSGATPRGGKDVYSTDGTYSLIRSQNVYNNRFSKDGLAFITEQQATKLNYVEVYPDDVLLNITGDSVARACQVAPDALPARVNQHVAIIRPDSRKLSARFLRYFLASPRAQTMLLSWAGSGGTRNALTKGMIESFEVQAPADLAEQRAIAHILGTLDDKIELNRRMNEALEAMAQALFKSWFIDFDPVRAKAALKRYATPKEQPARHNPTSPALRKSLGATDTRTQESNSWTPERARAYLDRMNPDIAALFPDTFIDSEIGEIPAGWEAKTLGDIVQTIKGRSYKSKELTESQTALVTLKSFARGGGYRPDGLKSFSGTYKPEQVVHPGEIVIACTDVTQAAEVVGRPAIVQVASAYRTLVASLDTLIARPIHEGMTRAFLYLLASTHRFTSHTYAHTTGTTVLHLVKEAVPAFQFAQPPVRLMHSFDAVAKPALVRLQIAQQECESLAALRDTLLPALTSGELQVSDVATLGAAPWSVGQE